MYLYAKSSEVRELTKWCEDILHQVQKLLKDYFSFDIRLIGSGDKKLVTQNGNNGHFDLDYNLILQKDKQNLLNEPKTIKNLFRQSFDKILPNKIDGYKFTEDSTSVLTLKKISSSQLIFSFDVAILVEDNDGTYFRLTFDKISQRYLWNQIPQSIDYMEEVNKIKQNNQWRDFRQRYLEIKNYHLRRNDDVKSFSIFLETLNEFR